MTEAERLERILSFPGECYVEWTSKWPACLMTGDDTDSMIIHRVTVHDAINIMRAKAKAGKSECSVDDTDANCIGEFIRTYRAVFIVPRQLGL